MISKLIGVTYFKNKLSKHSSKHDDSISNKNNDTSFPTNNSTTLPSKRSSICIAHRIKSKRNSSASSSSTTSPTSQSPTSAALTSSSSTRKIVTRSQIRRSNTISTASALRHSLNVSNTNSIPIAIPKKLFSLPNSPSLTSDSTLNEPIDDIPHFYNTTTDTNGIGNRYYGTISSTNNLMGRDGLLTLDLTTNNDTNSLFTTATRERLDNDLIVIDEPEQEEYNKDSKYTYGYGYEFTSSAAVAAVEGTKIAGLARSISKTKKKNVRFIP